MLDEGLGGHGLTTGEVGGWGTETEAYAGGEVGYLGVVGGGGVEGVGWVELEEEGGFVAKVVFSSAFGRTFFLGGGYLLWRISRGWRCRLRIIRVEILFLRILLLRL